MCIKCLIFNSANIDLVGYLLYEICSFIIIIVLCAVGILARSGGAGAQDGVDHSSRQEAS